MIFKLILTAILAVSLCSCQNVQVDVEYNEDVDFFKYKTFQWLSVKDQKNKDYTSLKEQRIGNVIREVLADKGVHFSKEKADVYIAVNIIEQEKVYYTQNYYHRRWGYHGFWDYEPEYYTESTLVIAFVEPETKRAVWEGSVTDWHFEKLKPEEMTKLIQEVLKEYPPTDTSAYESVK